MKKERLLSLDILRGVTIAAMILVNDPGSWTYVYAPLRHAEWHGCTPTDLIFPFFIFMVGLAIALGRPKEGEAKKSITAKILKRSLYLFLIGLFLNALPDFNLSVLRIPGVLQRIALVFLVIALLHHYVNIKTQVVLSIAFLLSYWIMLALIPIPGIGAPNVNPDTNFAAWFDRLFLSGHMWSESKTWDPEGLLSTLPSIVTGLLGMFTGRLLFRNEDKLQGLVHLFVLANASLVVGMIWDLTFPINKSLWTSSYVLYTGGMAIHAFALLYWLLDIKKFRSAWLQPFVVFGSNAITAYVVAGVLASTVMPIVIGGGSVQEHLYQGLIKIFSDQYFSSLVYAIIFVLICYVPIYVLYRKNIFIKV